MYCERFIAAALIASGSASIPSHWPPGALFWIIAMACPPPPSVQSTYRPPGWIESADITSLSNTGLWATDNTFGSLVIFQGFDNLPGLCQTIGFFFFPQRFVPYLKVGVSPRDYNILTNTGKCSEWSRQGDSTLTVKIQMKGC